MGGRNHQKWVVAGGLGALEMAFSATWPKIWFVFGLGLSVANVHKFLVLGGLLGAVRGHIVELEGPRGPFGTRKSSCMCRVPTISLHLAAFSRF